MNRRFTAFIAAATASTLLLTGCSTTKAQGDGVIDYWLWDSIQQPGYQKCADAFEASTGVKVQITQYGWDDYWAKLTAGFIADQAPDVFTNHLGKYAQFIDLEVLVPLDDLQATAQIDDSEYAAGLAELWKGQDGRRYGIPKDWDTVGYFYDERVTDAAGITREQLTSMDWNPDDGGSFEKVIAHLSVDVNGRRGDEPGFDKDNVAVYGLASDGAGGDALGQTTWGAYAGAVDWEPLDKNPWGRRFNMDDPEFQKVMAWYYGLVDKGYMPSYETFGNQLGSYQQVAQGKAVLGMNGSWMISSFASIPDIQLQIAPTPVGPLGHRASPFNGLADSITKFADDKEAAAKWVAYLGSSECQMMIAEAGAVFPARLEATRRALEVRAEAGLDVSAFTVHLEEGTTRTLAVTSNAADVAALTIPGFEAVYVGQRDVSHFTELNNQVNRLLELTS
ncbi:ABC transporter substrate-binding protein [Arachnia propionica]|uniref:Sugar ABC transporter substrate-binding protein n=1 Tax=Arachnia propionica TaxID=1750 RepID=A0A3P1WS14_9ACTN|nr:sugar ABC transporter substrate-binding protein [Arachnia propionica]RRD49344.1 sugar ABC transporter substrate-binding protein [Arachnia propionica]